MTLIHHSTVSGRFASEDNGVGHFDIIETEDGFQLHQSDGGMILSTHDSEADAHAEGVVEARAFDRSVVADLRRRSL